MRVLGISAFYHDSAAALIADGHLVGAAQEERFTRKKHDSGFPQHAVQYCLDEAGIKLADVDYVAFYDKPFLKFERLLETYLAYAPRGFQSFRMAMPLWLKEKLFQKTLLRDEMKHWQPDFDWHKRLLFGEHHQSHAASAFFPSPYEEAAVLCMDGVGEWATTSLAWGQGNKLEMLKEIHFPHSLGLLYSAFTYYTGFKVNSGEYKVMGLAPYGEPKFKDLILDKIVDLKEDGTFRLDQQYFDYCTGLRMTNEKFGELFGGKARKPEELLTQHHMDLAASVQAVTEEIVIRLARSVTKETGAKNICLAGGVALNCVANGKLLRENLFDGIWVQPAAGDAGGAVGAAYAAYHGYLGQGRKLNGHLDGMAGSYLGPEYTDDEIEKRLVAAGGRLTRLTREPDHRPDGAGAGRREGGGLDAGPHGVRAALARRPLDPGRRALAVDAEDAEPQGQVPRIVPALRAGGAARGRRQVFRHQERQPLHADGGAGERGSPPRHERGRAGAVRHRQAERAALRHPGRDPRRLFGAHPDGAQGNQPGLPRPACRPSRPRPAARWW